MVPNFSSVLLGTDNIFGSIELYGERGLDDIENNDAATDNEADEDDEEAEEED